LDLIGIPAVIAGICSFIGGTLMFAPIVRSYILGSIAADDRALNTAGAAGFGIILGGLLLGSILQAAINLGEHIRAARNKE
jgi:hypothetical protein